MNTLQSVMMMISMQLLATRKQVEVLYSDGVWYRGWLGDYNFETGKWVELMHFYEDS